MTTRPFPAAIDAEHDEQLALLVAELTDRVQRGEAVDLEAECRRHPQFAKELRELWGVIVVARVAGSNSAVVPPTLPSSSPGEFPSGTLTLPARFGDYELRQELGRGGMGVVYRARQLSLDREVAVKMILRGQLASQADRERFEAEAEAAARLDHPGIVPVYEVGEIDGRPYFSMKHVRGTTLAQRLADGPAAAARGGPHAGRGRPGDPLRPHAGRAAPRPQAVEHPARRAGRAARHRLRPGQADRRTPTR